MQKRKPKISFSLLTLSIIFVILNQLLYAQNSVQTEKPNVIIINADDLGYGDVGVYGATKVSTPNIDRLAAEGVRYTDFHSASAVCSPSRYALLTGKYPDRIDFARPIFLKTPLMVDPVQVTVADIMKEAGYFTGMVGKWHLGFGNDDPVDWNKDLKPGPLELGFDYYFGVPVLNSHPPFVYVENHKVVGLTPEDPLIYDQKAETRWFPEKWGLDAIGGGSAAHQLYDDRMVGSVLKDKALEFIVENKANPFFLYFATTNIHHPFTPAPRFIGTSEAGRYGDYIHELDWMVGEIMKVLDEEGLANNTLIIFTSDNGGMLNQGGQETYAAGHKINGNLLGFKFDSWEGGHRVPFIARWPGKIASGSISNDLFSNVDFLSTLASLTNRKLKNNEGPDSFNMLPSLIGSSEKIIRDHLLIGSSDLENVALRKGKWVFISDQGGGGFGPKQEGKSAFGGPEALQFAGQVNSDIKNGKIKENAPPVQLYNLEDDSAQAQNLYEKYPKIVREMEKELEKIRNSRQTRP